MPKVKSIRHYVTNIISFANSRSENKYHDRSDKYFGVTLPHPARFRCRCDEDSGSNENRVQSPPAGRVAPAVSQLMRDVWQPIIGLTHDIIVIRVLKTKKFGALGISIEGFIVEEPESEVVVAESADTPTQIASRPRKSITRHFVQSILPESIFGNLDCLRVGDEILQVNGYRIHGRSHQDAIRCLRGLPAHIELVIARAARSVTKNETALSTIGGGSLLGVGSLADAYGNQSCNEDATIYVAASKVDSVATDLSGSLAPVRQSVSSRNSFGHHLPSLESPGLKVSEWFSNSQFDIRADSEPSNGADRMCLADYNSDSGTDDYGRFSTLTVSRVRDPSFSLADDCSALDFCRNAEPPPNDALGRKMTWKPTWSPVPLVLMLHRTNAGFGFSFSEIKGESSENRHHSMTLDRKSTLTSLQSGRQGHSSTLPSMRRCATLPGSPRDIDVQRSKIQSRRLQRWGARVSKALLINHITDAGCVCEDGRLSIGDRLLFVNDRKLTRANCEEATAALQRIPNGYVMLGVSKLKMITVPAAGAASVPSNLGLLGQKTSVAESSGQSATPDSRSETNCRTCSSLQSFASTSFSSSLVAVGAVTTTSPASITSSNRCCTSACDEFTSASSCSSSPSHYIAASVTPSATSHSLLVSHCSSSSASGKQFLHEYGLAELNSHCLLRASTSLQFCLLTTDGVASTFVEDSVKQFIEEVLREALELFCLPYSSSSSIAWTKSLSSCLSSIDSLSVIEHNAAVRLVSSVLNQCVLSENLITEISGRLADFIISKALKELICCTSVPTTHLASVQCFGLQAEFIEPEDILLSGEQQKACSLAQARLVTPVVHSPVTAPVHSQGFTISISLGTLSTSASAPSMSSPSSQQSVCSQSSEDWLASLEYVRDTDGDSEALRSWSQDEFVKDYKNDHPLDYYTRIVTSASCEYLHAPGLTATPIPEASEIVVQMKARSCPLGIRLDALAAGGVDGCRVIQVLRGGAVEHSAALVPGDYITRINSSSMRHLTNAEAFQILRKTSVECPDIVIAFFPAVVVAEHRAQFVVSKEKATERVSANCSTSIGSLVDSLQDEVALGPGFEALLVKSPPKSLFAERLHARPWLQTCEIKLLKLPGEADWGIRLTGFELWVENEVDQHEVLLPSGITQPTFVAEVVPNTAAARSHALNPGDIIVGVNGLDASRVGCRVTASWINATTSSERFQTTSSSADLKADVNQKGACEWTFLYLLVLPMDSLPPDQLYICPDTPNPLVIPSPPPLSPMLDTQSDLKNGPYPGSPNFSPDRLSTLNNDFRVRTALISSDESSVMEEPASVVTNDVTDDLSVPQPLAFSGLLITAPQASQTASETERETSPVQCTPSMPCAFSSSSLDSSLEVCPSALVSNTGVSARQAGNRKASNSSVPCDFLIPETLQYAKLVPAKRSLESQSAWRNIGSQISDSLPALTEKYRRAQLVDDEIYIISMLVSQLPPSASTAGRVDCDTLGIRLVGHRDVNNHGVFICGIRPGSVAEATPGLRVADEIVQVNNVCVLGLTHLSAQLLISKEAESVRRIFRVGFSDPEDTKNALMGSLGTLYIVVRRNLVYNQCVMAKPANLSSHFSPPQQNSFPSDGKSEDSVLPVLQPVPVDKPNQFEIIEVSIDRDSENSFGLCLVNMNEANEFGVFVQSAKKADLIKSWDRIIAVNGQKTVDYDTTLQLLTSCRQSAVLRLSRRILPIGFLPQAPSLPKTFSSYANPKPIAVGVETVVELIKGDENLGISIIGGTDRKLKGIFIHEIYADSLAARDGRLKPGDCVLAVDEIDLRNATCAEATNAMRSTGKRTLLTILREDRDPTGCCLHTFTVVLDKTEDQIFGLDLIDYEFGGTVVRSVVPGSAAARTTLLLPDDRILEVNEVDVRFFNSEKIVDLLKQCSSNVRLKLGRSKSIQAKLATRQLKLFTVLLTSCPRKLFPDESCTPKDVFGFVLREAGNEDFQLAPGNLIVDTILPGSPAYQSGMIQPGDRLLGIDREPVDWLGIHELYLLAASFNSLSFEFGRLPQLAVRSSAALSTLAPEMPSLPPENGLDPLLEGEQNVEAENMLETLVANVGNAEDSDTETYDEVGVRVHRILLPFVDLPPDGQSGWVHSPSEVPVPRLGIRLCRAHGACGPRVSEILANSPASLVGLSVGDRLLGLDDHLLIAFGGAEIHSNSHKSTEKVLTAIEEAWLSRLPGPGVEPVALTVISAPPPAPTQSNSNIDGVFARPSSPMHGRTNFGETIGGTFYPSHRYPPSRNDYSSSNPNRRRWPKDVGDNLDVNLQAAPPGLISAFSAGAMGVGACVGMGVGFEVGSTGGMPSLPDPESLHLPGDRDPLPLPDDWSTNDDVCQPGNLQQEPEHADLHDDVLPPELETSGCHQLEDAAHGDSFTDG